MSSLINPWSPDGFDRNCATYYYSDDGIGLWYDDIYEEGDDA